MLHLNMFYKTYSCIIIFMNQVELKAKKDVEPVFEVSSRERTFFFAL